MEEQRIILTLASIVQPEDEDLKPYTFSIQDFTHLIGVKDKSKYAEIPKITKGLMSKVIELPDNEGYIHWLCRAKQTLKGHVELQFHPDLKPYMVKLGKLFTQYKLENILNMKCKYSPRIYELLKCNQFKKQGFVLIEIRELRRLLKIENIYPSYANLKQKILKPVEKELAHLTDISFTLEEIKTGRKVTAIKFYIHSKNETHQEMATTLEPLEEQTIIKLDYDKSFRFVKSLFRLELLSDEEINKILEVADGDLEKVKKAHSAFRISARTQDIINVPGWVIKAIEDDWSPVKTKEYQSRKKGLHNFKQRDDWDFDELERLEQQYQERKLEKSKGH